MYQPFAKKCVAVTCSNTVAISPSGAVGISVATSGLYTLLLAGDTVAVEQYLAAGIVHPIAVKRVNLTGNAPAASTGIVAYYV